jgi:single-strand DNA-binding protein
MFNRVLLIGRLTRDPEVKDLTNSKVAIFTIAVNRNYKDKNGEWKEESYFFDIEAFGKLAEKVKAQLGKGYKILIEGELRQDRWESESGEKRSKVKIVAERITLISKPGDKPGIEKVEEKDLSEDSAEDVPF